MASPKRALVAAGLLATVALGGLLAYARRPHPAPVTPEIRAAVELRQSRYREIGTAFKLINDELKSTAPYLPTMRRSAAQIRDHAVDLPNWFPAGSGPETGLDMEATDAVWERAGEFAQAQQTFVLRAEALVQAAAAEDAGPMREAAVALGSACKGCHDQFRDEDQ